MDTLKNEKNNIWNIIRETNNKLLKEWFWITFNKWNYKLVDHKLNYTIYTFKTNEDVKNISYDKIKMMCKRYLSWEESTVAFTVWAEKVMKFCEEIFWCEILELTLKNIIVRKNDNDYNISYSFNSLDNINDIKGIVWNNLKLMQ